MRPASLRHNAGVERLVWICGLVAAVFYLALTLDGQLSQLKGSDSPSYLILAKSLAEGYGFSDINIPGAPAHTQYPPFFPLLIAPVYMAFGFNFLLVKLVVLASAVAALFAVRAFFSTTHGRLYGTAIAVLTGTNFYFLFYTNEILSEIPYTLISFLVLLLSSVKGGEDGGGAVRATSGSRDFIVICLLLALAYMTRMIGVTLLAALCLAIVVNGRRTDGWAAGLKKALALGALASVPFIAWTIRGSLLDGGVATYQSIFAQADYYSLDSGGASVSSLIERFKTNCGYYFDGVYKVILTMRSARDGLAAPVFPVIFLLVALGFLRDIVTRRETKDFYFLFYMGLLTVWPVYGSGDARRYLVPMIPLVYHYLFSGVGLIVGVVGKARPRRAFSLSVALPALLLVMNGAEMAQRAVKEEGGFEVVRRAADGSFFRKVATPSLEDIGAERFREDIPCYYNYLHAAGWLGGNLTEGDVVATRKPEIVYLVTGGPTVRFPYTKDAAMMEGFMRDKGVSRVLLDACYEETDRYMRAFALARPDSFRVLLTDNGGTAVLAVQPPAGAERQ